LLIFLFTDNAEIVSLGKGKSVSDEIVNPVIVDVDNGRVICKVEAYPPPMEINFCYNGTCNNHGNRINTHFTTTGDITHMAQFTIRNMKEEDNGNVTCVVNHVARNITVNHTVMLFIPCKYGNYVRDSWGIFNWGNFLKRGNVVGLN